MSDRDLLSLGLDERDRLNANIGGGIPRGSIVLIEGGYGAGKSTLCQRFGYGACREGETVCYLSTELTLRQFLDQMYSLSYDVVSDVLDENLLFLSANLHSSVTFDRETGGRKDLLGRLMDAQLMWQADAIVIDSFDAILRNDPKFESLVRQDEERQTALEIISFLRDMSSRGRVIILTVDPTTLDDEALSPFRAISDIHLQLEMLEVGSEVHRQISVKRFAGMGDRVGATIGFSVRSETGIVIESRSVA